MDYEKNKEALVIVKQMVADGQISQEVAEEYFPELAESEDERIRKEIIYHIQTCDDTIDEETEKRMLAWLEKQGEMDMESYKAAEDEKREFIGDGFIKCYTNFQDFKEGETYWLEYVGNDNYNVRSDNLLGKTYHITPCQLYTIFKKQTWIEKKGEQKPWSEEDDYIIEKLLCLLDNEEDNYPQLSCDFQEIQEVKEWLKSLKDRVQPQPTWKPSDAQMVVLNDIIINGHLSNANERILKGLQEQLKKLKV